MRVGNTNDFENNLASDYLHPAVMSFIIPTIKPRWVKTNKKIEYVNIACAFDTESSSFEQNGEKCACVYVWTLGINGVVCMGRTWVEFEKLVKSISRYYGLSHNRRLVIYVHNLSWDFQFLRYHLKWDKIFALDELQPLYAISDCGIEFRCSYLQSGYNLEKLGEHLQKYHVRKMVGDLDYRLVRHSTTPLTDAEIGYILNDPRVVMAYIQEQIEYYGDITKIPLTNTGVVRQYCRDRCLYSDKSHRQDIKWHQYRALMDNLTMTPEEYVMAKEAFQGGFTHASSWKANKLLSNVDSFDYNSSYPAVMVSEKYPMGRGTRCTGYTEKQFYEWIAKYCCIFRVRLIGLESRVHTEHILSSSKCHTLVGENLDNGRVISAKMVETTLTDVDFINMIKFYTWENIEFGVLYRYNKQYLPTDLIQAILDLYRMKTELKNVQGREVEYLRSKGMLNACYGMCVTDPCREEIVFENGKWGQEIEEEKRLSGEWIEKTPEEKQAEESAHIRKTIQQYNTNKNRFLFYIWGIYVTAYARNNLLSGVLSLGSDYIYSDTDSVKVLNIDKHLDYFDKYNREITRKIETALKTHGISPDAARPKTKKGVEKPLGVWDREEHMTRFKTLGAKRYMVEYENGEMSLTVSGIRKTTAMPYLRDTYGDNTSIFNAFSDDLVIPAGFAGKKIHSYINYEQSGVVVDYTGKPGAYHELSGVHLAEAEYHLKLEHNYMLYLFNIWKEIPEHE